MQLPKIDLTKISNDNGKDNELTKSIKDAIKNSGRRLWSYSRLSKYHNCKYEYYLGYILRPKNPRDNVYSILGGIVHECLEGFIKKEYSREQMIKKFELIYSDCKIPKIDNTVILKFPSEKIEKNYIECIRIFLKNYEPPKADIVRLEVFLWELFNNNKIAVHGYADCILGYKDDSGNPYVIIDDFKTSSKFGKDDMLEKGRQLVMYAYMYTKRTGIPVKMVRWNMCKYYEVNFPTIISDLKKKSAVELKEFLLSKGVTQKLKKDEAVLEALKHDLTGFVDYREDSYVYQRNELYIKTHKEITSLLRMFGISDIIISENLSRLEQQNTFNCFDEDILGILNKFNFTAKDWYNEYTITQDIIDEMENWIISTVNTLDSIPKNLNESEIEFYYPPKDVNKDCFYCENLCGYAKNKSGESICKHYKKYLEKFL